MPLPPNATAFAEALENVDGVVVAQFASTDGMEVSQAPSLDREMREQLAARVSTLYGVAEKSGQLWNPAAGARKAVLNIEIEETGWLLIRYVCENTLLAVLTKDKPDLGVINWEMERLVKRVNEIVGTTPRGAM